MTKPWPTVKLGEVLRRSDETIELQPDLAYRQITVKLWGKGVVLRGILTGAEIAASRQTVARRGQFILSRIDARNGALGIVPPELDEAIVTNDFPVFNVVENRLLPTYLGWMCRTASFVEECKRASEGTTNRVRLQEDKFLACEIPLPPLAEQRRVVARIEALAVQIHEARTLRHQAAEEAEALLTTARRAVISESRAKTVALEDACEAIIDNLHSNPTLSETGIPCVRSPDVGYGTLDLDSAQRTDEDEFRKRTVRGEPKADDIVLVREGGGTGKCAVVLLGQRFSLGQRVMMLRPNTERILPRFFLHQLLSPQIQEDQIAPLSKGSASPHLNIGTLRRFNLVLPPLPEQRRIVSELDALQAEVDALKRLQAETAQELDALLPSILDRAFKGEL
jgi:type I restriction enzyme S subunit